MPRSKWPRNALSVIHFSESYAWPALETYAVARAIPVNTCSRNANRVALPNTYIHPVRGGTGCFMMGPITFDASVRASNHCQAVFRKRMRRSGDGSGAGQNLHLPLAHADRILHQRTRRRPGGNRPVFVVHTAVTGTHEQFGVGQPAHRTAQVSAVDGKGDEAAVRLMAKPRARPARHARPRDRGCVVEADLHGLALFELRHRSDAAPRAGGLLE